VSPVFRAFKRIVLDTFGNATEILADFGFEPRKVRKLLSGEQIAAATAIKGDVTGIVVTPVTHAAASRPSAAEPTSNARAASGAPK
jgi:hypothetical protein